MQNENDILTSGEVVRLLGIDHFRLKRLILKNLITPEPWDHLLDRPQKYLFRRAEVNRVLALREQRTREWEASRAS